MLRKGANKICTTQVSLEPFGRSEQANMVVVAMTVTGPSSIHMWPPEAAVWLESHDSLPPIIVVAEPLVTIFTSHNPLKYS